MKKSILAITLASILFTACGGGNSESSDNNKSIRSVIEGNTYYSVESVEDNEYEVDYFDENKIMNIKTYSLSSDALIETDTMSYTINNEKLLLSSDGETNTCSVTNGEKSITLVCTWNNYTETNILWKTLTDAKNNPKFAIDQSLEF